MRSTAYSTVLLFVALIAAPGVARGDACQGGCLSDSTVCARQAAISRRACKLECASDASPRACRRGCRTAMRSARATCGTSLSDCQGTCPPAGTCPPGCGTTAQTCFANVVAAAKTCVQGCTAAGASGLGSCLEQCAAQVRSGAAVCRAALGTCLVGCVGDVTGDCFDTMEMRCTDQACSPSAPCTMPNEFCAARCAQPPPAGTCFNRTTGQCGGSCAFDHPCSADGAFLDSEICVPVCPPPLPSGTCLDVANAQCGGSCSPTAPCPANQLCVPECPPPPPTGQCFVTVDGRCTDQDCSPRQPCTMPNEICTLRCPTPPGGTCLSITRRQCTTQSCSPTAPCPSGDLCVLECPPPSTTTTTLPGGGCQSDGDCDDGNGCTADRCLDGVCQHECICVSPAGGVTCCPGPSTLCVRPCGADASGTCGGFCPNGETCEKTADATTCGCVSTTSCIPFFQSGCSSTSDCCQPCGNGIIAPCAVCLQGVCEGAP